ncbi:MAG: hypothetical protein IJ975_04040 [Clostridia bacterium]|nr:hypothetical protein [Clostridia bacterium]
MDKVEDAQKEDKTLDIQAVLNQFSFDELKFQACQNHLIGNFDKDKKYHILEIILPELIKLDKVVAEKNPQRYTAFSKILDQKIWFAVEFEKQTDGKLKATLVLEEKFVVGGVYEATLQTPLSVFIDNDAPDFAAKMRKSFHLFLSDDDDEKSLWEDYVSPPIELVTELIRKTELLPALSNGREKRVAEYLNQMLKALKTTPEGTSIAKLFFIEIRQPPIKDITQNRTETFKAVLDKLIDAEIAAGNFSEAQMKAVAEVRQQFIEATKHSAVEFYENKTKTAAPVKEKESEKPKEKTPEKTKGGTSSTPPAKPIEFAPSTAGKFFENSRSQTSTFSSANQAKEKKPLSPKTAEQKPRKSHTRSSKSQKKEGFNAEILARAMGQGKEVHNVPPAPSFDPKVFFESMKISITRNYDLGDVTISVTEEYTQTTHSKENDREL